MIIAEGLYDRGYLVDYGVGEIALHRNLIKYQQSVSDIYHTVTHEDNLLIIARKYYGFSSLWYMIADVNDSIEDIFILPVGDIILIPSVSFIQSFYGGSR
jgi:nucleoid-associated protein YgaU